MPQVVTAIVVHDEEKKHSYKMVECHSTTNLAPKAWADCNVGNIYVPKKGWKDNKVPRIIKVTYEEVES
jgi:hypothetical protein